MHRGERHPANRFFAIRTMRTLRSSSAFDLIDRIEQQLNQQLQQAERVPAAEVHETAAVFQVFVELPGVDKDAIAVKATDRTPVIRAERHRPEASQPQPQALVSEFRYGTWSRSFRFPQAIEREQLQASYQGVTVKVEG